MTFLWSGFRVLVVGSARSATGFSPPDFVVDARRAFLRALPLCLVRSPVGRFPMKCLPLDEVLTAHIRLRPSCPLRCSRPLGFLLECCSWPVSSHIVTPGRGWIFLLLPSLVLPSPARGGSSRTRCSTNETRRRCQDWLNGFRLELWDPLPEVPSSQRASTRAQPHQLKASPEPSFDLDERTAARVHILAAEGALRRACTALTADPPVSPTPAVIDELRLLHPVPTPAHRDMIEKLRPVS